MASSKSAMKQDAPEFSALTTILRSTGPVISTRRSWRSAGIGATFHSRVADRRGLGEEVGQLAGVEARLALGAEPQQAGALGPEAPLEVDEELEGLGREDALGTLDVRGLDLQARERNSRTFLRFPGHDRATRNC